MENKANILSFLDPPGCITETLRHPVSSKGTLELALFQDHRFAFYYWLKWSNERNGAAPSLVTYDWHQDLCQPYEDQIEELKNLDVSNKVEVALYAWGRLSHHNDVQIWAAMKHNKIGNVYAICRQKTRRKSVEVITDFAGNPHTVFLFKSVEEFEAHLPNIHEENVYFDIDLDYFTLSNPFSTNCPFGLKKYTYMKRKDIVSLLSPSNATIQWIFERLAGFTIATEPEFCGGLKQSNYFLQLIDNLYFFPSLFYNVPGSSSGYTKWKHFIAHSE